MKSFLFWAIDRLQERSTLIGIVGAATTFGWYINPDVVAEVAKIGAGVASLILILTKDKP